MTRSGSRLCVAALGDNVGNSRPATAQTTGFPGDDSFSSRDAATIGEILKQNGYATSWFGKAKPLPTNNADFLA